MSAAESDHDDGPERRGVNDRDDPSKSRPLAPSPAWRHGGGETPGSSSADNFRGDTYEGVGWTTPSTTSPIGSPPIPAHERSSAVYQALARIPIEQMRLDRRVGLNTATFVSGYPGSPLGGFDGTMRNAAALVPDLPIECRPAINEEYAATAIMGSQLAATLPDCRYDGVVGIWYGKSPGSTAPPTRCVTPCTPARPTPEAPSRSSATTPRRRARPLPSSSAGLFERSAHADALSRRSGRGARARSSCDRAVTRQRIVDGNEDRGRCRRRHRVGRLDPERARPVIPEIDGLEPPRPTRRPAADSTDPRPRTRDLRGPLPLATAYAARIELNRATADPRDAWIGIAASGITYRELREAFRRLGLPDEQSIAALGIRLLKLQLPLPFDPATVREFARGLEELLVIEEKQPNIELLVKDALYASAERPRVLGKVDERGNDLIAGFGALDADTLVPALRARTHACGRPTRSPSSTSPTLRSRSRR